MMCMNVVSTNIFRMQLNHGLHPCTYISLHVRYKWQKIRAVQMYIEHLVLPLPENEQVYKGAFRLWSVSNIHVLQYYIGLYL